MATSDVQVEYVRALREVAANQLGSASSRLSFLAQGETDVAPHARALLAAVVKDAPTIPAAAFKSNVDRSFAEALHEARKGEQWRWPRGTVALPFEREGSTATPVLPVVINGKRAALGLDTGAGLTVIGSELADAVGAKRLGARTGARDAHGENVGVELATVNLDLGGIRVANHPVIILDSARLRFRVAGFQVAGFDGVLGWNAIRRLRIEIDNPARTIRLASVGEPFLGPGDLLWVGEPYVRARAPNGLPVTLFFDTGASRSALSAPVAAAAGLRDGEIRSTLVMGAGSSRRREVTVYKDAALHVGGSRVAFGELQSIEPRSTGYAVRDGVLGADALLEGKVLIDFSQGLFSVRPSS